MMDWIKSHPLMTGGVVLLLVVLFLVFRKSSGGTQVINTGQSDAAINANLQATVALAGLQAQYNSHASDLNAAIASKKLDTATTLQVASAQKDVALTGILSGADVSNRQTAAALLATQYSTDAVVQQQRINADTSVKITGIQADVVNNQTAAQLAAQGIISKATVDVATLGATSDQARTAAALAAIKDTNSTSYNSLVDTNASNVSIAGTNAKTATDIATLQAQTDQLKTTVAGNVYTDFIDSQAKAALAYINGLNDQATQKNTIVSNLVSSGTINKGGEGGKNQVGLLETWLGNFQGGVANANQTPDTVGTTASGFTGIANAVGNFFSHIF